jgi:hypothetical protein
MPRTKKMRLCRKCGKPLPAGVSKSTRYHDACQSYRTRARQIARTERTCLPSEKSDSVSVESYLRSRNRRPTRKPVCCRECGMFDSHYTWCPTLSPPPASLPSSLALPIDADGRCEYCHEQASLGDHRRCRERLEHVFYREQLGSVTEGSATGSQIAR